MKQRRMAERSTRGEMQREYKGEKIEKMEGRLLVGCLRFMAYQPL